MLGFGLLLLVDRNILIFRSQEFGEVKTVDRLLPLSGKIGF
jgi:hypothetical protein